MNKKNQEKANNKLKIIIISVIAIILLVILIIIVNKKTLKNVNTTFEERIKWNNYLNEISYLSELKTLPVNIISPPSDTLVKIALTSSLVKEYELTEKDRKDYAIPKNQVVHKKSIKEINKFKKKKFNVPFITYNDVKTYIEKDSFLIIGYDYIYYTKIKQNKKIFIPIDVKYEDDKYSVLIYEYIVNSNKEKRIKKMLKTGKIRTTIACNKYYLSGIIKDNNITVTNKEMLDKSTDPGITIEDIISDLKRMNKIDKNEDNYRFRITQAKDGTIGIELLEPGTKINKDDIIINSVDVGG